MLTSELHNKLLADCPIQHSEEELNKLIEAVDYNIYDRKHFSSFKKVLEGIKEYESKGYVLVPEYSRNAPNGGLYTLCFIMPELEQEQSKQVAIEKLVEDYQLSIEVKQEEYVQEQYKQLLELQAEKERQDELNARIKKNTALLKLLNN